MVNLYVEPGLQNKNPDFEKNIQKLALSLLGNTNQRREIEMVRLEM